MCVRQLANRVVAPARTLLVGAVLTVTASSALCQGLPTLDYAGRAGEKRPELLDRQSGSPPAGITLPAPAVPLGQSSGIPSRSILVKKIVVTGSTVFTPEEISKVTAPYENRSLSMENLESLRREVTSLYVTAGYINSGAIIPAQGVTDGIITLRVVEGTLNALTVQGNTWFSDSFIRDRIELGVDVPLNINSLQSSLQLLQQDQRFRSIHAELRPGSEPGESHLSVRVEEKPPVSLWTAFNNYQSSSIGAERGMATLTHLNLTGHGDVLSVTYGYSSGLSPLIDTFYALPLNAYDTTLMFRYRKNDNTTVDKAFGPLDIVGKTDGYELNLRQPLYRSLTQEFALSLAIEQEFSDTWLGGEPFSFSPGTDNGHAVVVPLRLGMEWTHRTRQEVIAARSRFTFGLNALGATHHGDDGVPDGQFFAWLGQLQYTRILDLADIQILGRIDIQRATKPLLSMEQFGVGGRYTVRGYRENLLVRDEALITSVESRIPLLQNYSWADYLQFCQFFDYGQARNVDAPTATPSDLSSIGLGLRWGTTLLKLPFELKGEAEIYWGYQLRHLDYYRYEGVQDNGIHYQIALTGFF